MQLWQHISDVHCDQCALDGMELQASAGGAGETMLEAYSSGLSQPSGCV